MAQDNRDRVSIDLRNLREKVELLQRSDPKLSAMNLSQVLRYLVEAGVRLESGEVEKITSRSQDCGSRINVLDLQKLADQLGIPSDRLLRAIKEIKLEVINGVHSD